MVKKILLYTDDITERAQEWMKENYSPDYELVFVKGSENIWKEKLSKYDAILLDYGMMGGDIQLVRRLISSKVKLAWYSSMSFRCNKDAKTEFLHQDEIHCLPNADLDELQWLLDEVLFSTSSETLK